MAYINVNVAGNRFLWPANYPDLDLSPVENIWQEGVRAKAEARRIWAINSRLHVPRYD